MTVRPQLHRSSLGGWQIAETAFHLRRGDGGWVMTCARSAMPAARWLRGSDLRDATFSTRIEALRAFMAASALAPAPDQAPAMRFVRVRAGLHRSANGRYELHRQPDRTWTIMTGAVACGQAVSLADARRVAAQIASRPRTRRRRSRRRTT